VPSGTDPGERVVFLTPEWCELHNSLAAELPEEPGATGVVNVVVRMKSGVSTALVVSFEDGRQTMRMGIDPDADFQLEFFDEDDAAGFMRGDLDVTTAISRGRLGWEGDVEGFIPIAVVLDTEAHQLMRRRVAQKTMFP